MLFLSRSFAMATFAFGKSRSLFPQYLYMIGCLLLKYRKMSRNTSRYFKRKQLTVDSLSNSKMSSWPWGKNFGV